MYLISKHPIWFLVGGLAMVLGALALFGGDANPQPTATVSISGGGDLINPGMSSAQPLASLPQQSAIAPQTAYVPIRFATGASSSVPTDQVSVAPEDIAAQPSSQSQDDLLQQLYALMPSYAAAQSTASARTPEQQALYTYGNEAGLALSTFQNAHTDSTDVLKQWLSDTAASSSSKAVAAIANDLVATGAQIGSLASVPRTAQGINANFAASMQAAGKKLLAVQAAGSDDTALVSALKDYDAAADALTVSYLAIVDLFSISGVKFTDSDTGAVFSYGATGSI